MTALSTSSNVEWRSYGKQDYGVSHDLSSGIREWALLRNHLNHYGLDGMSACVEIGCGAGRLTNALAQDFSLVHALDVSPDRIKQAGAVPNSSKISFHLVEQPILPIASGACDFCISTHVLQHIGNMDVIRSYLREMFRVLRPGGCMLIHAPVVGAHGMTGDLRDVVKRRTKDSMKAVVLMITRQLMNLGLTRLPWKIDHYNVFSFVKLDAFLRTVGFVDIELRILSWAGGHSYLLARKPSRV